MEVTAVATAANASTKTEASSFDALNGQAFLQLLVAQLQNQDPMNPMDNQQFISQLAQLSSLEKLESIGQSVQSATTAGELGLAANLIGRTVEWTDATGATVSGEVSEVRHSAAGTQLLVGESLVPLADLTRIAETVAASATTL